jgi:pimeloyl-ACP methyl ester carboxylesterase
MASAHEPGEVTWVEVPGGRLAVETFRSDTEPVLAIHGISSQRKLWNWLRAAAPDLSLIAPDLRGRGDSTGVTLPSSIGRHAADIFFGSSKWRQLQVPVRLLTAEWSTGADSAPAYPAEAVQSFRDALDVLVTVRPVPGVDHAASIMAMTGARASADLIAEALNTEARS